MRAVVILTALATLTACMSEPKEPPVTKAEVNKLEGTVWVLEDLGGKGIAKDSRADASFTADGMVYGRGSCNRFTGSWKRVRDGVSISMGPIASTMMACEPALMDQEQKFLKILSGERRLNFQPDGSLRLGDGAESAVFRADTSPQPK